jgi:ABC-type polysaccharide/polyol phosphate export permease
MLIASGVILAPQDLPFNIQLWFSWNPSAVIIDQMRVALFHTPPIPQSSIPYCLFVTLCLDGVGLLAYYSKRHKLAVDA